jgi:hypothetical protein
MQVMVNPRSPYLQVEAQGVLVGKQVQSDFPLHAAGSGLHAYEEQGVPGVIASLPATWQYSVVPSQ